MATDRSAKRIGLAIVGAGRIGLIRGEIAARHPSVGWIGIAETLAERGKQVAERLGADFVTAEAHDRLMLTKALDLSARRHRPVALPITPEDERA